MRAAFTFFLWAIAVYLVVSTLVGLQTLVKESQCNCSLSGQGIGIINQPIPARAKP